MASFLFYFVAVIVSLLAGGLITFLIWGFFALIKNAIVTRGIPKNRKKLTEYLKENQEKYKNPGLTSDSEKEVYDINEQRRARKFREFEKLRRDEFKARVGKSSEDDRSTPGGKQLQQQRELLPNGPSREHKTIEPRNTDNRKRVKLDE